MSGITAKLRLVVLSLRTGLPTNHPSDALCHSTVAPLGTEQFLLSQLHLVNQVCVLCVLLRNERETFQARMHQERVESYGLRPRLLDDRALVIK